MTPRDGSPAATIPAPPPRSGARDRARSTSGIHRHVETRLGSAAGDDLEQFATEHLVHERLVPDARAGALPGEPPDRRARAVQTTRGQLVETLGLLTLPEIAELLSLPPSGARAARSARLDRAGVPRLAVGVGIPLGVSAAGPFRPEIFRRHNDGTQLTGERWRGDRGDETVGFCIRSMSPEPLVAQVREPDWSHETT
jgi:hypothetical protein